MRGIPGASMRVGPAGIARRLSLELERSAAGAQEGHGRRHVTGEVVLAGGCALTGGDDDVAVDDPGQEVQLLKYESVGVQVQSASGTVLGTGRTVVALLLPSFPVASIAIAVISTARITVTDFTTTSD